MAEKYDLIFSLGSVPIVAQMLKQMELQIFDFPFDKISGGSFLTRMSLFLLDCANFMEQKNISVQKNTPREGITTYKDLKTGFVYLYDFNPNLLLENNFPSVKLKYDRYIKNLRLTVNAAKKILLLYVEDPQNKEDDEDNMSLVLEATQKLKNKYPNKNFKILYVKNSEDIENMKVIQIANNAEKFEFNFYRQFSEMSSKYIDASMLSTVLTDIELKKSWRQKKLFFYQKLLNKVLEFRAGLK